MKDGIILFLKENIIGRNLFTEDVVYKLENGKLEGVYSDRMIFSDLMQYIMWIIKTTGQLLPRITPGRACSVMNWPCGKAPIN